MDYLHRSDHGHAYSYMEWKRLPGEKSAAKFRHHHRQHLNSEVQWAGHRLLQSKQIQPGI